MKTLKSNIARNLTTLRQLNKYSQEDVAEQIGVSRQAVAKWESGESVPDIVNCDALAQLYKANGTNWREGNGRPKGSGTAQARVYEWRQQHPEGRKADCHRETGLDPKTIRKWWDCPPPAVRFENGHITVRVSPSQELSDWLLDTLHDGGQE